MKIGVDAKWFFRGPISGKLFVQNVLPELFALHPEIEWHLFLNKKDRNQRLVINQENLKVHYVWAGFNMLSNLYVVPKLARRLGLDAVLFQTFSPRGKQFKSVVFIHDVLFNQYPDFFTWAERLYFSPLKWTAKSADRIITTTQFVKDELKTLGYSNSHQPIDLAPSGITEIFKPIENHDKEFLTKTKLKYNLPDSYLLFVGRLNARKNIKTLVTSLSFLRKSDIQLVIVGEEDWKSPQLKHLLNDSELMARITFTGGVTNEELSAIYAMAGIFCFPSFAEGFGLPPLEAMASGIPVVVSNTASMPEVCGSAALYANPNDPRDIADKINLLLENKSLYAQKRAEGLEWAKRYTWKRTAVGIMKSIFASTGNDE
jgi:glycosyltransferase involved in cell wall biosynthesis